MDAGRGKESEAAPVKNRTTVERKSERELLVTRTTFAQLDELLLSLGASAGRS